MEVPVWKARRIARATRSLSLAAARWVDRQLIGAAASNGTSALDRLVELAVARVDPEGRQEREEATRTTWDVTLDHTSDWAGTSTLTAVGDTVALGEVLARVNTEAESLAHAVDEDGVGARRVKALVSLARYGADQLGLGFEAAAEAAAKPKGSDGPDTHDEAVRPHLPRRSSTWLTRPGAPVTARRPAYASRWSCGIAAASSRSAGGTSVPATSTTSPRGTPTHPPGRAARARRPRSSLPTPPPRQDRGRLALRGPDRPARSGRQAGATTGPPLDRPPEESFLVTGGRTVALTSP